MAKANQNQQAASTTAAVSSQVHIARRRVALTICFQVHGNTINLKPLKLTYFKLDSDKLRRKIGKKRKRKEFYKTFA